MKTRSRESLGPPIALSVAAGYHGYRKARPSEQPAPAENRVQLVPSSPRFRRIAWLEPARLPLDYDDQNIYSGILFPRGGPKMAALLKSLGYEVEVISGDTSTIDADEIAANFDLACISVLTNTAPHGMILGRWLGERGMTVIMGGYQFAHTSTTPAAMANTEQALDFVPYVVRGEGYAALPQLLEALEHDRSLDFVPGLSYRTADGTTIHNPKAPLLSREAINALPLQDWSTVRDRDKMKLVAVHGMQGCPRECSWCAVWTRDGQRNRNTDAVRLVDELQQTLAQTNSWHVFFSADNFPVIHTWANDVCDEILARDIDITWTCQAEVGAIKRTELVDKMVAAGCQRWCLGLESVNLASLQDSQKRQTRETMEECVRDLHRRGVAVHGMFIVGLPHDTPASVQQTVDWALEMGIETCQFLCLADLPGSQDFERPGSADQVFRPFSGAYEALNAIFVNGHYARVASEQMDHATVQRTANAAMLRFYSVGRALSMFFSINWPRVRAERARGRTWLKSLTDGWHTRAYNAIIRLRGVMDARRWLKNKANAAYMELLSTDPASARAEELRGVILGTLPPEWLATLEQVQAERLARPEAAAPVAVAGVGD